MIRILEQHERPRLTIAECLIAYGYPVEALPYLKADAERQPNQPGHWNNLGICHKYLGNYPEAFACFDRALAINPGFLNAHHNYAMALEETGHFSEALKRYALVCANSTNPEAQYGFAQCALREGKYDLAMPMWEPSRLVKKSAFYIPNLEAWRGQDLDGKKILVTREGGYGDIFWLMRYLKPLKDLGAHVTFHVFRSQRTLLEGHPWIDCLLDSDDEINEQEFDYQIPLWSVMWELRKREPDKQWVPLGMEVPYLKADRADKFDSPAVGICWGAGEILAIHRKLRSIQDEYLPEFAKVPVNWVSLVPGEIPGWCRAGVNGKGSNWKATAAMVAGLDLVVASDSAVFHLAAAMGKPTIVFCPCGRDWKFLRENGTTSWYPSVKVITNPDPVSFKPVVDRIVEEVTSWVDCNVAVGA